MITDTLKIILNASGCTLVVYDQQELINLYVDQSKSANVVGLIMRPVDVFLEVRANAIAEHYNPLRIEILQQVRLEDKAENNEAQLQTLLDICKQIIVRLIAEAEFKTLTPIIAERVLESRYDANVIGWSIPLDLYWFKNETRIPCL